MAEYKIYLGKSVHTGHIREASQGLSFDTLRVIDFYLDNIRDLENNSIFQHTETALRLRILKPDNLPKKILTGWKRDEKWVVRLLNSARQFTFAEKIDDYLVKILEPNEMPKKSIDALVFFSTVKKRVNYLLSNNAQDKHPTLSLATNSLAESRILHQAIFNRRYLVPFPDLKTA